jgi:thiol:disulfide interchange protein
LYGWIILPKPDYHQFVTTATSSQPTPSSTASKPIYFILIVIVIVSAIVALSKLRAKEIIPWRTDVTVATTESAQSHKPILAYFTATWCGPCQSLKSTTWADKSVDAALRDFIPLKIDIDQNPTLATNHHITAVPTFVILSSDGSEQRRTEGALNPTDFLTWLREKQ